MKIFFCAMAVAIGLSGCAGFGSKANENREIAIVAIELPDFCSRVVETQSDFAVIRPHVQTVIAQGCQRNDGMGDAPVVWLTVDHTVTIAELAKVIEERAVQSFAHSSTKMQKVSKVLADFVSLAKKNQERTIRIIGHADVKASPKLREDQALARAKSVASYLEKQGIEASRIQVVTEDAPASNAVAVMTLVVIGQK